MAGLKSIDHAVVVEHPAGEVWQTFVKNLQVTLPRGLPETYASIEYLDGPPLAPGGVFRVNYNPASFPHYTSLMAQWEEMDHDNYYVKVKLIEGGSLNKYFGTLKYTLQLRPGPKHNTCLKQWALEYDDIAEHQFHDVLKEELSFIGSAIGSHLSSSKAT